MRKSIIYIITICVIYAAMTVYMCFFPRSTYSELEQRELAQVPQLNMSDLMSGKFTSAVSSWFSDTEPGRDRFMKLSMEVKSARKIVLNNKEAITFHAPEPEEVEEVANEDTSYVNENAKLAHSGIIIVGTGDRTRALMGFKGYHGKGRYVQSVNAFAREFAPDSVQVYCMLIPSAACFYTPDYAKKWTKDQRTCIDSAYKCLDDNVKKIHLVDPLKAHSAEPIYLRTDHHWSPLGAFYASRVFAKAAGVPFKGLDEYDKKVVKRYVGSMYGYSKDISVKKAPEDFVYYVPKDSSYSTEYTRYKINSSYKIEAEYPTEKGNFFYKFPDGSSNAYCTFMGSDGRITKVTTSVNNGRRLLILKDSFGNPIPSYLFSSFEQIFVVDFRYFNRSIKKMVRENKVTDILFANALSLSISGDRAGNCYLRMINAD